MNTGKRVRLDFVCVKDLRHVLNLDEWLSCFDHLLAPYLRFRDLLKPNSIRIIPTRHVGQYDRIALVQSLDDLDRIHRGSSHFHWHPQCSLPVRTEFEQTDRAALLPKRRPPDIENVVQSFEIDGPVHA